MLAAVLLAVLLMQTVAPEPIGQINQIAAKATTVWRDPEDGMRQWYWGVGPRWSN